MILLVLGCLMFFVTGCTANYYVDIDENLYVKESLYISEKDDFYKPFYKSTKYHVLDNILEIYKDVLQEKKYDAQILTNGEPQVEVIKQYPNIEEYLNSSILFNDYFENIKYNKVGDLVTIETENFHKNDPDDPERFIAENLNIIIRPAFKVKNSNATKIDEKNNAYYFEYNNTMEDFKIFMELDLTSKFNPNIKIIIIIIVSILCIVASWGFYYFSNRKKG